MSPHNLELVERTLTAGPFPTTDGWHWMYRLFARLAPPNSARRRAVCRYFLPGRLERWGWGRLYRLLGVHLFGAIIPTGGVAVRRLTGARMAPYTLARRTVTSARSFYYRTCVFETLHLPFLLALLGITIDRAALGRLDLAAQDMLVNLALNIYPIMHHRRTRTRIVRLLTQEAARKPPEP
ncbi:MAG: hypothetical protein OEY20_04825 [Gemmatimonadota bacterium]|nr:hypothetical protein [Gemmatimonadota bacterium]MDH4350303.1 hypothetical protein [Gemmatimonadota bacterium]MDH5196553.1 hypothetical protein [Gemmatimonadota bacterium]